MSATNLKITDSAIVFVIESRYPKVIEEEYGRKAAPGIREVFARSAAELRFGRRGRALARGKGVERGRTKRHHAAQGHSAPGPITLSVYEGRIRFSAAEEEVEAGAGTMLACDAGVRHSVRALDDAVCLLNVAAGGERRGLG